MWKVYVIFWSSEHSPHHLKSWISLFFSKFDEIRHIVFFLCFVLLFLKSLNSAGIQCCQNFFVRNRQFRVFLVQHPTRNNKKNILVTLTFSIISCLRVHSISFAFCRFFAKLASQRKSCRINVNPKKFWIQKL